MNLILDLGNSRCKYALADYDELIRNGSLRYSDLNKFFEIEKFLYKQDKFKKIIVSSVLNKSDNSKLAEVLDQISDAEYYFLQPDKNSFGIELSYEQPSSLGADRLAALIAADEKYNGNKCIVDCGTAITVDVLTDKSKHLGGLIFPGIQSMQNSLSKNTDLEWNASNYSFNCFANSTQDAIYSGCLIAVAGGIQMAMDTMQKKINEFDEYIITGGDAELVLPLLSNTMVHEPNLVLEGLRISLSKL